MQSTDSSANFRTPHRWNSVPVPERVAKRAYERVEVDEAGCWISLYSTASHGYSQIGWTEALRTYMVTGHRAAWVHVNGQLPLGMTLDHVCKKRTCVNPDHLRVLPNYENSRRINGADFPLGGCRRGHTNESLVPIKRRNKAGGERWGLVCGPCDSLSKQEWEARNPERRKLLAARKNWRRRHPGDPLPDRLLLESERQNTMSPTTYHANGSQ